MLHCSRLWYQKCNALQFTYFFLKQGVAKAMGPSSKRQRSNWDGALSISQLCSKHFEDHCFITEGFVKNITIVYNFFVFSIKNVILKIFMDFTEHFIDQFTAMHWYIDALILNVQYRYTHWNIMYCYTSMLHSIVSSERNLFLMVTTAHDGMTTHLCQPK